MKANKIYICFSFCALYIICSLLMGCSAWRNNDIERQNVRLALGIYNDNAAAMREAINAGADLNNFNLPLKYSMLKDEKRYPNTALGWSLGSGNCYLNDILIESGLDLNRVNSIGETCLYLASFHRGEEELKHMIENGADPTVLTKKGESVLDAYLRDNEDEEFILYLLEHGTPVTSLTLERMFYNTKLSPSVKVKIAERAKEYGIAAPYGRLSELALKKDFKAIKRELESIPEEERFKNKGEEENFFQICAAYGTPELFRYFEEHGITPLYEELISRYSEEQGRTYERSETTNSRFLYCASTTGNIEMAEYFLEKGADIDYANDFGYHTLNPLLGAVRFNQLDMAEFLLKNGAEFIETSTQGGDAIEYAAYNGNIEMLELLIEYGYPFNDDAMLRAVTNSIEGNQPEMLDYLLNEKNSVVDRTPETNTVYMPLETAVKYNELTAAQKLIEKGAEVNGSGKSGNALLLAYEWISPEMTKLLLENGADPNRLRSSGISALHLAVHYGDLERARILIEYGSDTNIVIDGMTLLHEAALGGSENMTSLILNADPDLLDKQCNYENKTINSNVVYEDTALHIAARMGWLEAAKVLTDAGADVSIKNSQNETPLDIAKRSNDKEMIDLLSK